MSSPPSLRIRAFDWLRGIAILGMIPWHAVVLLRPELHSGWRYSVLNLVARHVAPSFLFAAGFSLALVQVRGAAAGTRLARVRKTLRRIGEVLAVATLVNWAWFPIFREPKWILRIDILQCIGVSLLLALPLLAALAPRPKLLSWVTLLLALAVFGVAPYGEAVTGPWAAVANGSTTSVFPLLPWAGYVYLGASAGAVAARGELRALVTWIVGLGVLGAVLWQAAPLFAQLYPPHNYWVTDPANHGQRWMVVCGLVLLLLAFEHRAPSHWTGMRPVRFVEVFGYSSLAAYFFHEMLLFFHFFGFSYEKFWGKRSGWGQYALLTLSLITLTYFLTQLTDRAYRWVNARI